MAILGHFGPRMAVFWDKNGQIFVKAPGIPPQTSHLCIKTYKARKHTQIPKVQNLGAQNFSILVLWRAKMAILGHFWA